VEVSALTRVITTSSALVDVLGLPRAKSDLYKQELDYNVLSKLPWDKVPAPPAKMFDAYQKLEKLIARNSHEEKNF